MDRHAKSPKFSRPGPSAQIVANAELIREDSGSGYPGKDKKPHADQLRAGIRVGGGLAHFQMR